MDAATAYLLLGAALVAVAVYPVVMDQLSQQALQDAYEELIEEEEDERTQ